MQHDLGIEPRLITRGMAAQRRLWTPLLLALGAAVRHADSLRVSRRELPFVKDLAPIYWLHVPKAGSSFETTLAHHVCGAAVPSDFTTADPHLSSLKFKRVEGLRECYASQWESLPCATARWNAQCGQSSFLNFQSGHYPLPSDFPDEDLRHVVAMFREPTQRAISGWLHDRHDCVDAETPQDYAACVGACAARMLTGGGCGGGQAPSEEDFEQAARRAAHLGFVGLTGEWDLTVCLFHAMHGGPCKPEEFFNARPGDVKHDSSGYNVTQYLPDASRSPSFDDRLYARVEKIFWERIEKYGVSREQCEKVICPSASSFFELEEGEKRAATGGAQWNFDWPGRFSYAED